jgi:hypothetical protein
MNDYFYISIFETIVFHAFTFFCLDAKESNKEKVKTS